MKLLTLTFIIKGDQVLLGMKKRGVGNGWWNGFGGKVEPNEDVLSAAIREVREEANLEVSDLIKFAVVRFNFEDNPIPWEVHFFKTEKYSGEPLETEEMRPQWFAKNNIPFSEMWDDDPYWFPLFLAGDNFKAEFWLDKGQKVVRHNIEIVECIV